MLHPTQVPNCENTLLNVMAFQEHLLQFACVRAAFTQAEVEAAFGKEVSDWLYADHRLIEPIVEFAGRPPADKAAVLAAFQHDRAYPIGKDDSTFRFQLTGNAEPAIKKWLVRFFERLEGSGFPAFLCGGATNFRKEDWVASYLRSNAGRRACTCAVCEGTMKDGKTIEHYFPKSLYPVLSVHPHNLLPLCKQCNNVYKRDLDPLDGRPITHVFLPYHRPVRTSARLTFTAGKKAKERITLDPLAHTIETSSQVEALAALFHIPEQWQTNVDEICEIAWSRIRERVEIAHEDGVEVDDVKLIELIDNTCRRMEKDWGTFHFYFPATEWLRWARHNRFNVLRDELLASVQAVSPVLAPA